MAAVPNDQLRQFKEPAINYEVKEVENHTDHMTNTISRDKCGLMMVEDKLNCAVQMFLIV